ncbi:glycosyltransferase family 2 protein [Roseivirga echinicomitans]|uniref:Glycosyl transferase family 2 n=1 Tax=Roseivirga echinicomitans TaxID=296218 RepID=A0A150XVL6_9BACT|nr:glycosyltransferase family 2 protein [Roseivirga echinicomitans]KYG82665.1 glycosyl transferase family 2 [Roseivirga echinicomitans]
MSKISVALLNYNGKTHLENFLPSVVQFSTGYDIVVIDNGSSDDTLQFLKSNYPTVRIISYAENHGFCGGYNKALKELEHEFVVLLNTDVQVTEGWIEPILELMESDSNLAAVQPKILDLKKKTHFEYAGASGGYLDILGYPFCRGRVFHTIEEDKNQYQETQDVFWASGASLFVRRSAYFEAGGLDEDFFAHMEEIDLCWRFWNLGYKVKVCPESVVYHLGGGTLDKSSPRKTYLNFRNGLTILLKNENTADFFWKFPVRLFLDWLAIAQFSVLSGLPHGLAIIRAHFDFMRSIPRQIRKRKSSIRISQNNPRYNGLVIWDYFIKQKKTYRKINF